MKPDTKDRVIITGTIGSHSYGTATPTSDYDYMSCVIASPDVYLGLHNWGQGGTMDDTYDDPVKGFVEHRYFEMKKFIGLCTGFNPNVLPLLWLEDQHYEEISLAGMMLIKNRNLFNSKRAYHTFSGYAHGQLQKMGGIFNDDEDANVLLRGGHVRFQELAEKQIAIERALRDEQIIVRPSDPFNTMDLLGRKYDAGFLNALIALKAHSKEEIKRIKVGPVTGRMGAKRKELREQFGFDTKFAFHTIRLMRMCNEFLTHPEEGLKVNRKGIDAEFLYSIREGKLSQEDIKKMADELFAQAKEAVVTSPLPDEPDNAGIHSLCVDIIKMTI